MSKNAKTPAVAGVLLGGSDRRRSGDLSIFSRTLYQLSYRAEPPTYSLSMPRETKALPKKSLMLRDPDGTRTRDLRRDRAAR